MTHDPLCPVIPADKRFVDWGCQCDLIAKVRADERKQAEARVETLRNSAGADWRREGTKPPWGI